MMEISECELLARLIYDALIIGILRILSHLDLTVTRESDQQQVVTVTHATDDRVELV